MKLFSVVWERGGAPSDFKTVTIVPIYKKSSKLECSYQLQRNCVVGKVFARVMNESMV